MVTFIGDGAGGENGSIECGLCKLRHHFLGYLVLICPHNHCRDPKYLKYCMKSNLNILLNRIIICGGDIRNQEITLIALADTTPMVQTNYYL